MALAGCGTLWYLFEICNMYGVCLNSYACCASAAIFSAQICLNLHPLTRILIYLNHPSTERWNQEDWRGGKILNGGFVGIWSARASLWAYCVALKIVFYLLITKKRWIELNSLLLGLILTSWWRAEGELDTSKKVCPEARARVKESSNHWNHPE